jgi:hypothetical protein
MKFIIRFQGIILIAIVLAVTLIWKIVLLKMNAFPFNADEAVVGLMARHIINGERPIFFYGQAYMGSLDAFLVAGAFMVLGQKVIAIRIVQIFLYLCTIITTALIGKMVFRSFRAAVFSVVLMAIPTVNLTLYTTVSLGGYGEALLIGNLVLLIGIILLQNLHSSKAKAVTALFFGYGVLSGLGFWANALTLVYSASVGIGLITSFIRKRTSKKTVVRWLGISFISFLLGCLPVLIFVFQNGITTLFGEISGSAVNVETASYSQKVLAHFVNFSLFGIPVIFGLRPPWETRLLAAPLLPLIIAFWLYVTWYFLRKMKKEPGNRTIWVVFISIFVVLISAFIFTSFGIDPSGRYFLPLTIITSIIAGGAITRFFKQTYAQFICMGLLILFNLWGTLQCALKNPPGITTQFDLATVIDHTYDKQLIDFLEGNDERGGYSNYWVTYPLAFQSSEELIYTPRLPYHTDLRYTPRDDRYAPYDQIVSSSERTAFITTNNPQLDQCLKILFAHEGVSWEEKVIGDYTVYYGLSGVIQDMDLDHANCRNPK